MRFSPYKQATSPNIVVDGSANEKTVLTLSHWPKSGTPHELKADTSAEIAFKYLDSAQFHIPVHLVTNNHFDQDGLVSVFALTEPDMATHYRALLIDVASAGDFGVFQTREAARINFAVSSLADPETSPLSSHVFTLPYPEMAAELYIRLLEFMPRLIAEPNNFKSLWETEDARLISSERLVETGAVTLEEQPELDFAVVRVPESLSSDRVHRFTSSQKSACHPLAIYNRTPRTRILLIQGQRIEFQYRYEGWVQLASRRPAPRVDLSILTDELNSEEKSGGLWKFDGVAEITPRLYLADARESSIPADLIREKVVRHLRSSPPAWDPYD